MSDRIDCPTCGGQTLGSYGRICPRCDNTGRVEPPNKAMRQEKLDKMCPLPGESIEEFVARRSEVAYGMQAEDAERLRQRYREVVSKRLPTEPSP